MIQHEVDGDYNNNVSMLCVCVCVSVSCLIHVSFSCLLEYFIVSFKRFDCTKGIEFTFQNRK